MLSLVDLPVELVMHITELSGPQIHRSPRWERGRQAALAGTCRYLYVVANPILYRGNLTRDGALFSCIMWAAMHNKIAPLKAALRYGADLNQCRYVYDAATMLDETIDVDIYLRDIPPFSSVCVTPLQVALRRGSRDAVEFLIQNGADPHIHSEAFCKCDRNWYDPFALRIAVAESSIDDAVDLLVTHGNAVWERNGKSFLPELARLGRKDLLQHLLDLPTTEAANAALLYAVDTADKGLLMAALTRPGTNINQQDERRKSVLYRAIEVGNTEFATILLGQPSIKPVQQDTVIAVETGNLEVLKLLLLFPGISLELESSYTGRIHLHMAAQSGRLNIVQFLVNSCNADVMALDFDGNTPLHKAIEGKNIQIVKFLLNHPWLYAGAMSLTNATPLGIAIDTQQLEVVELLLDREDVDPNEGFTTLMLLELGPMYLASVYGNMEILEKLFARPQVNPSAKDKYNRTVLHHAVLGASEGLIQTDDIFHFLLAQPGISATDEDANGFNLLHILSPRPHLGSNPVNIELANTLMKLFISKGVPLDKMSPVGTPFYIATITAMGDLRHAANLLSCGSDPTIAHFPHGYESPLHHCLSHQAPEGLVDVQVKVLSALLQSNPNLEVRPICHGRSIRTIRLDSLVISTGQIAAPLFSVRSTPLCFAVVCARSVECTKLLLEAGASAKCTALVGSLAMMQFEPDISAHPGRKELSILGAFLRSDILWSVDNPHQFLHSGWQLDDFLIDMITLLLKYGAQIDREAIIFHTPLFAACELALVDKPELLDLLLENSTKSNCTKSNLMHLMKILTRSFRRSTGTVLNKIKNFMVDQWPMDVEREELAIEEIEDILSEVIEPDVLDDEIADRCRLGKALGRWQVFEL